MAVAGGWGAGGTDSFPSGPGVVAIGLSSSSARVAWRGVGSSESWTAFRRGTGKDENGLEFLPHLHRSLTCGTAGRTRGRPWLALVCQGLVLLLRRTLLFFIF